jgi:hypothetical protein
MAYLAFRVLSKVHMWYGFNVSKEPEENEIWSLQDTLSLANPSLTYLALVFPRQAGNPNKRDVLNEIKDVLILRRFVRSRRRRELQARRNSRLQHVVHRRHHHRRVLHVRQGGRLPRQPVVNVIKLFFFAPDALWTIEIRLECRCLQKYFLIWK